MKPGPIAVITTLSVCIVGLVYAFIYKENTIDGKIRRKGLAQGLNESQILEQIDLTKRTNPGSIKNQLNHFLNAYDSNTWSQDDANDNANIIPDPTKYYPLEIEQGIGGRSRSKKTKTKKRKIKK